MADTANTAAPHRRPSGPRRESGPARDLARSHPPGGTTKQGDTAEARALKCGGESSTLAPQHPLSTPAPYLSSSPCPRCGARLRRPARARNLERISRRPIQRVRTECRDLVLVRIEDAEARRAVGCTVPGRIPHRSVGGLLNLGRLSD